VGVRVFSPSYQSGYNALSAIASIKACKNGVPPLFSRVGYQKLPGSEKDDSVTTWKKADGQPMTAEEIRRHTANHIFGLAKTMRLLMDGLKQNVGPEVLSEDQLKRLRAVAASLHASRNEMTKLSQELWELQDLDEHNLHDTTKM